MENPYCSCKAQRHEPDRVAEELQDQRDPQVGHRQVLEQQLGVPGPQRGVEVRQMPDVQHVIFGRGPRPKMC